MLWGNDAEAVWVKMRTPVRAALTGKVIRWDEWDLEALAWPQETHPSGREGLVRVSYIYVPFNGWVRKDRTRPRL